ncbi:MAG: circadian clock KaiB family protein [Nostocales cyanobacterium 94392]|nr:circadian clock KaiB family protein [Nostocales cyanobacterium 94392]
MNPNKSLLPELFKGIALFTPGGDLIYCIDSSKKGRWHSHLCSALQSILDLPEPPHFLVPLYTATIDHWLDPRSGTVKTFAEAYPAVMRHQTLLNAIFNTENLVWQKSPWHEGLCDSMALATYRSTFEQLWENHDLIVRLEISEKSTVDSQTLSVVQQMSPQTQPYIFRLFVAGHTPNTENTLQSLHELLEKYLGSPYTLKVIDVLTHPEQAEIHQVSATPTLVKVLPKPTRRIVGDMNSTERILQMLGILNKSNYFN